MAPRIPLVDVLASHRTLGSELSDAVARVLASGRFIQGAETRQFEEQFQSGRLLFQPPLDVPCQFLNVAEVQVSG